MSRPVGGALARRQCAPVRASPLPAVAGAAHWTTRRRCVNIVTGEDSEEVFAPGMAPHSVYYKGHHVVLDITNAKIPGAMRLPVCCWIAVCPAIQH
jgi:hypothetical protein